MDHIPMKEVVIDIECNLNINGEAGNPDLLDAKLGKISSAKEKNMRKEKCKSGSTKKPPKPPRPPRGLSMDAADQKLIKEIAELAMIKRARIERMKALKKMKVAKASSMSSSSGNLIAMLFTIIFCIVIIFQGISPGNNSVAGFHGSPETNAQPESGFIMVHDHQNIFVHNTSSFGSGSPNMVELAPGSDINNNGNRDIE